MVASAPHLNRDQRLAQARAALVKAHALTGVKTPALSSLPRPPALAAQRTYRKHPTNEVAASAAETSAPIPNGTRGRIWHLAGGNAQLLDALARATSATSWLIFIALPNFGWCAAAERGLPLERTIVVRDPATAAAPVMAAAIDNFDLLVCGPLALPTNQQRALAARLRARRATCFTTDAWPGISHPWQPLERFAQKVG